MVQLKIRRQDGDKIWHETFQVEDTPNMNVLDALFYVQERIDGSLCFRYSCRGAVCGSCAMLINKVPRLACRTQVADVKNELNVDIKAWGVLGRPTARISKNEILIEPMPNLTVIRDLVVDMEKFYELLDTIEPWMEADEEVPEQGHLMSRSEKLKIETYTNCILCAVCHGTCPAVTRDEEFLSPAILAKVYRFQLDPRENDDHKRNRLEIVDSPSGVWGCETVYKCTAVCPKMVTPTQAITGLRRKIFAKRIKNVFRRDKNED